MGKIEMNWKYDNLEKFSQFFSKYINDDAASLIYISIKSGERPCQNKSKVFYGQCGGLMVRDANLKKMKSRRLPILGQDRLFTTTKME